jgi:hypothetical protein
LDYNKSVADGQPSGEETSQTQSNGAESQESPAQIPPSEPYASGAQAVSDEQVDKDVKALEDRVKKGEIWMIVFTGALVFVGLCQFGAAILQWRTMSGQLKEMHDSGGQTDQLLCLYGKQLEQATVQARAARSAADTARQTLSESIDSLQLDERPWVYVSSFNLSSEPEVGKDAPKISITPFNSGKTPALDVKAFYETFSSPIKIEPTSTFKTLEPPRDSILPPNFPGGVIGTYPINSILKPGLFAGYGQGKVAIYINVKITYSDEFGNRYWTTACAWHTHDYPDNVFTMCKKGNEVGQYNPRPHSSPPSILPDAAPFKPSPPCPKPN